MDISSCEPSFNSSIPQSQSCYLACISIQRLVTLPQAVRCTKGCFPGMSILQTCNYCLPIPTSPAVLSLSFSSFTRTNNALAILLISPTLLEPRCTHPKRKALSVAFAGRVACMPLLCSTPFSGRSVDKAGAPRFARDRWIRSVDSFGGGATSMHRPVGG